jgi:hypothetical protein
MTCVLRHLIEYFHCAKNFNQQTRSQQYIIMRQNHRLSLDFISIYLCHPRGVRSAGVGIGKFVVIFVASIHTDWELEKCR